MNEETTGKLVEDFKVLIDDVEVLVKATANQAGERIGDLRQRLEKKIEDGRKALAGHGIDWFEKPEQAQMGAELSPREKGWAGLVIASAIGVLLGLLVRRRRKLR
jgi:ElaB/YqjD/DUF883 family membrane-anchored ribosome-binding protein